MPRYKESERAQVKAETRQLLLEAATEAFARQGYEKANINQISRAAGFAKGTIYNYFESKRALMQALIHETAQAHLEYIAPRVLHEEDAETRLKRFFDAGWSVVSEYLPQFRLLVNTLYGADEELKVMLWQVYQPMHQLIHKDILDLGIEQGVFRAHDSNATTGLIMSLYLGIASQADDEGKIWLDSSQVADFVLNALRE
ncbi:MAG: TetR family transcriptional regulator [Anaerolineales bacterium]|nr:TetR family transcriptional regulator [Anaerolineales bacterium]